MRGKSVVIFFVILALANCNVNQEFMNGLRGLLGTPTNAAPFINACENHHYFYAWDLSRAEIDGYSGLHQEVRWLKGQHHRNLPALLRELKFGRKIVSLTFENYITAGRSGVLAKAFVAVRNGDSISSRAAVGSATCDMTQQFNVEAYRDCKKILFIKKCSTKHRHIPRGFHPHELMATLNHLQQQAAQVMYDIGRAHTGLGDQDIDASLQSLYLQEAHILRRFYPEIQYDYAEMDDVPHHELPAAIHQASHGQIGDHSIFARIQEIAGPHGRASFFHAPNASFLYVMSINRNGANYLIRMSSFRVDGRLPAGAFAWSVGGWNLERGGQGTAPSSHELVNVFPPLK